MLKEQFDTSTINWEDFSLRWNKARVSAIRQVLSIDLDLPLLEESEENLFEQLAEFFRDCDATQAEKIRGMILRCVFDYSRMLALSLSKRYGVVLELKDFAEVFGISGIPCARGDWEQREAAAVLTRTGCTDGLALGTFACDYWREAMDGIVMGLGESERYVRHACARRGDSSCVDVVFIEDPKQKSTIQWAKIPSEKIQILQSICTQFHQETGVEIILKGMKEGVLHYMFHSTTDEKCGGHNLLKDFRAAVAKAFPDLQIKDVTPMAVLGMGE